MRIRTMLRGFVLVAIASTAPAQQIADPNFAPPIPKPAYAAGRGPLVLVDEAHHNFHTATGRYKPFADLLSRDGYVVRGSNAPFSKEALAGCRVLVIANALNARNAENWTLPTPSAFTDAEILALKDWVTAGGSLLLIADHMPFPGAAYALAKSFGVTFSNGFAIPAANPMRPLVFAAASDALGDHAIVRGRDASERITSVTTFTGSAFKAMPDAAPLLVFREKVESLEPHEAWKFDDRTPRTDVTGWLQGAALRVGKGRVAVFGEAAMFTAQLGGARKSPMGMNSPDASQNAQFLMNVLHWLSGIIDGD